ncbi:glycosyltransferase [Sphingobium sp. BYY-5]|uniref:glycosyltransferase n=1 Tax=Sphingobium sp. BYY-5 TaxID=2926400 RepID=UPI001FA7F9F8|nr:glycosyltransferase [Sphingobium sp. BYY-5]MCI4589266.1 glycosyltransferase [Sphingobium sp. BYY-5]
MESAPSCVEDHAPIASASQLPAVITNPDPLKGATIVAYPDYTATNPYQNGLYGAFRSKGSVEFGTIQRALELVFAAEHNQRTIFHLHWPDPLFSDVVDGFDYQVRASNFLQAVKAFKAAGGIFLWTVHNRLPHDTQFGTLVTEFHRHLAETANLIHLHSESALAEVRELYALDERKCVIIPHGSYEGCYGQAVSKYQSRQLLGLKDVDSLVLFFGQIRPYKGLDELIRAFHAITSRADRDQVHLLIAGKPMGGFTAGHARLMEENNPRIHILDGFVPDSKVPLLFGAADIIALPYRDVLTSGNLMLAANYGKPVVAPRLPALSLVDEADLGILYEPDVPGALTDALEQALDLDHEKRAAISIAGRKLSSGRAWSKISDILRDTLIQSIAPQTETIRVGRKTRTVETIRKSGGPAQIGLGIIGSGNVDQIGEQLSELHKLTDASVNVYIFDDCSGGVPHYGLQTMADVLVYADARKGTAAATNILLSIMRDDGCEHVLLLDPNVHLDADALSTLLSVRRDNAIVSAVIVGDNGRIAHGGYRSFHDHSGCLETEPLLAGDDPLVERDAYTAHALDHRVLFFPIAAIDQIGLLSEELSASHAVLDWSMAAKRKGMALVVEPSIAARNLQPASPNPFPGIDVIYNEIRGRFQLARKWARKNQQVAPDIILDRLECHYIAPLRKAIAKAASEFLPLFERCVEAGVEDAKADAKGMIDVSQRIDIIQRPDECENVGRIDRKDKAQLCGWIAERDSSQAGEWRPGSAWLFRDGKPHAPILPSLARTDVADAGYCEGTGFTLPFPRRLGEDRHAYEIRTLADGRRLPVSDTINGDVWSSSHIFGQPQEPYIRAHIDSVADGLLQGWVADLAHPDVKIGLDIRIEHEAIAENLCADIYREDLKRARIGDGRHGFALRLQNRHLLQENLHVELRLTGNDACLTKTTIAVQNDNRGFSPYFSMRDFLQWAYCEDRMGAGRSELATSLLRQFEMEKRLLKQRADQLNITDLVSVIMPAFNRADIISAAIQSVLEQSYRHFELIIVDDGSTDDTAAVVASFDDPRITLLCLPSNQGVSAARNHALHEAKGEIIAYLDSDNQWDADYLAIMTACLTDRPGYQSAYAGQIVYQTVPTNGGHGSKIEQKSIRLCPFNRSRLEERNFIDLNIFVHRRKLHGLHGGFDDQLRRLVDWELILRYTKDWPPLMVPALLGSYHAGKAHNQITETEDFNRNRARLRIATPAMSIQTTAHAARGLDIVVLCSSEQDLRIWTQANRNLLDSTVGTVVGVWNDESGVRSCTFDAQQSKNETDLAWDVEKLATITGAFERISASDVIRPLLIARSDHAIRGDWARLFDRLPSLQSISAATGRLYQRSTHSRFGSVYHDLMPEKIKSHIQDWAISPSLAGQKSRVIPREYLFIPADNVERMRISAGLTRDIDDMMDRYFDSFALTDVSCIYAPDLIACHRDDILLWSS